MSEANKALVRRYYESTFGDLSGIEGIVASTFVDHHFPPDMPPGPAGVRKFFTEFIPGIFSDTRIEIDFLLAEGNKVDCHFVFHGTHSGDGAGIPASGNLVRVPAISTFRIADGILVEAWEIYDAGGMVAQMQAEAG